MKDPEKAWFNIVKHKFPIRGEVQRPEDTTVVKTVRGRSSAEQVVEMLVEKLSPEEKQKGWTYYLKDGTKPAGVRRAPTNTRRVRR